MKPGTAAIIAMFEADQRLAVEQALPGSPAKSVVETDNEGHQGPHGIARRGHGQVRPGPQRTAHPGPHLRRRGRPHARGFGRRLAHDPGPQGAGERPERPPRPHRRRRLRRAGHLRRPGPDPGLHARPADGPGLQPLPRDGGLLADPRGAPHRPQPAPRRLRLHRRVSRAPSRATPPTSPGAAPPCRASSRRTATSRAASASGTSRRTTSRVRPGPSTTGRSPGASTTGGASSRAPPASTTRSSRRTTGSIGVPEGKDDKPYYFPDDITDKSIEWLHRVRAQDAAEALVPLLLDRLRPRPAPRRARVGGPLQGRLRRWLGQAARAHVPAPEGAGHHPAGRGAHASARTTSSRPGTRWTTTRRGSTSARRRSTPASRRTPTGTSAGSSMPSTTWATWRTP